MSHSPSSVTLRLRSRLGTAVPALAIGVGLLLSTAGRADDPPTAPILRVETGMHNSSVGAIATDAQQRWLVTASLDKTARIWDLSTHKLIAVLRTPLAAGLEGQLDAVAMSPDGKSIALGGWIHFHNGKPGLATGGNSLYIIDRASTHVVKRLEGLPFSVEALEFSPDGRYLAAGLANTAGVRVWRTDNWDLTGQDPQYTANISGLDFSHDGRLVTSSYDGNLRVYTLGQQGLRGVLTAPAPGGKSPESPRFSPDGAAIAVGFNDATAVNVLDSRTLGFLFSPDLKGVQNLLNKIAWSADGQYLYAAGTYQVGGTFKVRRWLKGGHGASGDAPASRDSIMQILALPNGGVAFAASDRVWGTIDAGGVKGVFMLSGPLSDFRNNTNGLRVSNDATAVRFSFEQFDKAPARFHLATGLLTPDDSEDQTQPLAPARTAAPGLEITDWHATTHPSLNGHPLPLSRYEVSRSVAVAPNDRNFVLGTAWYIRYFDNEGHQLWSTETTGEAWAINISGDGRTVVAALSDGTLRWYDAQNGREKLAFLAHTDRKRWVAWTPTGLYAASPGAENLIGWHVNNGLNALADFYPASRFHGRFYRPDVIAHVIATPSEAEALRLADQDSGRSPTTAPVVVQTMLPPILHIESPQDGVRVSANKVAVSYSVRSPSDAPISAIRARLNGQAVNLPQPAAIPGRGVVNLDIPSQDAEIQLFAENKNGVSPPALLHLTWAGVKPVEAERFKPKLYVLAVGVSKYANKDFDLGLPAKDAQDLAAVLLKQKGRLYSDVQVRILTDAKATKDDILDGLEWLKMQVTARDVGVMFLAGHGTNDNTGRYYFLPYNADPDKLMRTGVPQSDIRDTLNSLAGKAVFFVDTCHAGNALGTARTRAVTGVTDAFVNELTSAENGVVVFTAATGKQFSLEDERWGNGAFTKAVVEGLSGKADFEKTGRITHKALDLYVSDRVKQLTNGAQSPVSIVPEGVPDFPLAVDGP